MDNIPQSQKLVMALATLNSQLIKRIENQLSFHGISYSELMVLHHLNSAQMLTMRRIDLAEAIGLTASGITRMLKPMEKLHLIEKEPNRRDARVSLVKLTPTGEVLYKDAWSSFHHSTEQFTNNLDNAQLDNMLTLLSILR